MNTIAVTTSTSTAAPVTAGWAALDAARLIAARAAESYQAARAAEEDAKTASHDVWCETYDQSRAQRERVRAPFVAAKAAARTASLEALRASEEARLEVRRVMEAGGLRFYAGGGSGLLFYGEEVKGYQAPRETASRIAPREGEAALCTSTGDAYFLSNWVVGPIDRVKYAYPKRYAECARRR